MKKLLALLLVLIIATLSVVSCGISKSDGSTNKGNGSSTGDKNNGDDDDDDDSGKGSSSKSNKIAYAPDSMSSYFASTLTGVDTVGYDTASLAANAVAKGKAAYALMSNIDAISAVKEIDGLQMVDIPLAYNYCGLGVDKMQYDLIEDINNVLDVYEDEIELIVNKYLCNDVDEYVGVVSAVKDNANYEGQLVISTDAAFSPYTWQEDGLFYGIDMEVAALIADALSLELVIEVMDFDSSIVAVGYNGVDAVAGGLFIDSDYGEHIEFSDPYACEYVVVVCKAGSSAFVGLTTPEEVIELICKNSAKPSEPEKPGDDNPTGPEDPGVIDPEKPGDTEDPGDGKPGGDNPGEEGGESTDPNPSNPETADIVYQIIDDSYAVVTGYWGTESDVVIASTYEGYPVKAIESNAFSNNDYVVSVYIPASIQHIKEYAFAECWTLESVVISGGSNLSCIDTYAFMHCTSLNSINLRAATALESIGYGAFYCCYDLHDIYIPASVGCLGAGVFSDCDSLVVVEFAPGIELEEIPYSAFAYSGVESIIIPASVEIIRNDAFNSCYNLESVTFESGSRLYQICEYVFSYANSLSSITLPETLTYIGSYAFYNNDGITNIHIPASVESIGSYAFEYCDALTTVTFDEDSVLDAIYEYAFRESRIESISIPSGVSYIGYSAFEECYWLESVVLPDEIDHINSYVFYFCSSLESVYIPAGVGSVYECAFYGCTSLESVTFEEGSELSYIGISSFEECYALADINLGDCAYLTMIDEDGFSDCTSLTSISLPASISTIGLSAFGSCYNISTVYYGGLAENWAYISISSGNTYITSADRVCADNDNSAGTPGLQFSIIFGSYMAVVGYTGSADTVVIPDTYNGYPVQMIGEYAFYDNDNITSVYIPSSVVQINQMAFACCSYIEEVTFGENSELYWISSNAFYDCTYLSEIYLPAALEHIGEGAFSYCSILSVVRFEGQNLKTIDDGAFAYCDSLTEICLPAGLETIGYAAFRGGALRSVVIPKSVYYIDQEAFDSCYYMTIYYCGSESDWSDISIDSYNDEIYGSVIYYNCIVGG